MPRALTDYDERDAAIAKARGLLTIQLRDTIAHEREQGRAFGYLAEACRDELAKRTGDPRV